jgi:oligopeptide/dipeptide ABC transporter ATP-binding protein
LTTSATATALSVRGLEVTLTGHRQAPPVKLVCGVSFHVLPGETTALVGESGCGKSLTAMATLGLLPLGLKTTGGEVWVNTGSDKPALELMSLSPKARRAVVGPLLGFVPQDALAALNPLMSVGALLAEATPGLDRRAARDTAIALLTRVGIQAPAQKLLSHPHALSGGQRQRVLLALALARRPRVLLLDEPTTALDVTVQAQILALLADLQREEGLGLLLITHDLGVVAQTAHQVHVMYAGQIVETAPTTALFTRPQHPYTQALLQAIPSRTAPGQPLVTIPGTVPDPRHHDGGCRFLPRCPKKTSACQVEPPLVAIDEQRAVRCHHPGGADP